MPQHRIGKSLPPSQQSPAPSRQLMKTERLQQAIIRAQIQAPHPFLHHAPARQHQHSCVVILPAHLFEHLSPILARQAQIQNHQVRLKRLNLLQRGNPIPHPSNLMPFQLQALLQKQPQSRIVFNNQNPHSYLLDHATANCTIVT
jgi:hypothetical protein